jgi:hypothetical protein
MSRSILKSESVERVFVVTVLAAHITNNKIALDLVRAINENAQEVVQVQSVSSVSNRNGKQKVFTWYSRD